MKTTRIFGILAVFAVAFALLPLTAQTAFADEVTSISGMTVFPFSDYAKLNKPPAPLTKDPDNTELRITWTDDGFAAGYEIAVTNVTGGFAPRSTTITVNPDDTLLVSSGGKVTYNPGLMLHDWENDTRALH